jgi:chromosome segregation ATPase
MRNPALVTLSVLLGLSLAAGAWLLRTRMQVRAQMQQEIDKAKAETARERERSDALLLENEGLRRQLAERGIPAPAPAASSRAAEDARRLAAIRELTAAQARLTETQTSLTEARNRIAEIEASLERVTAENKRLTAAEAALNEDLDHTRRVVQAMEAEIRAKNERIAQLEASLRKTREELQAASQRAGALGPAVADLIELNRRRENTVTSLQRRYRDITDQLRALSVRLDTQRDNPAAAIADISRIQTAVLAAEEDLRQLSTLNSQSQQLMQKLSGR